MIHRNSAHCMDRSNQRRKKISRDPKGKAKSSDEQLAPMWVTLKTRRNQKAGRESLRKDRESIRKELGLDYR